jgi:hypothetical protein
MNSNPRSYVAKAETLTTITRRQGQGENNIYQFLLLSKVGKSLNNTEGSNLTLY